MNIFLIQTIKASGLSIRLKAVRLLAKRDVSVSHNLMYFQAVSWIIQILWFLFHLGSIPAPIIETQSLYLAVKTPQQHNLGCVQPQDACVSLGDPERKKKSSEAQKYSGLLRPINWLQESAQEGISNKFESLCVQRFLTNINMNSTLFLSIMKL